MDNLHSFIINNNALDKFILKRSTEVLYNNRERNLIQIPLQHELNFYSAIKNGNISLVKEFLDNYTMNEFYNIPEDSKYRDYYIHTLLHIGILSRYAVFGGLSEDVSYAISEAYYDVIELCQNLYDLDNVRRHSTMHYIELIMLQKRSEVYSPEIRLCQNYISSHLHDKITTADLATLCSLSERQLIRRFYSETGKHISEYIIDLRITNAKYLLAYTDFSILEISTTLGFSSQSHFTHTFKKILNITPAKYRQKHKLY